MAAACCRGRVRTSAQNSAESSARSAASGATSARVRAQTRRIARPSVPRFRPADVAALMATRRTQAPGLS